MSGTDDTAHTTREGTEGQPGTETTPEAGPTAPGQAGAATDTAEENTPTGDGDQGEEEGTPNREAAKYRTKLREAEAQRDALQQRLDAYLRGQAEALAAGGEHRLHKGADLWLGGHTLADVLGEGGEVDAGKVAEVVKTVTSTRPYLQSGRFKGSADQGTRGDGKARPELRMGSIFAQK